MKILFLITYGFSRVLYLRNETTDWILAGGFPKPVETFLFVF
jgi:hypothetical protein